MKRAWPIITLLIIIAGGLVVIGNLIYEQQQQEQAERARQARIEREEAAERRRRAEPCYGISLDKHWVTKSGLLFTKTEKLYVRVSNRSDRPKFVTFALTVNGHDVTKRIKVYNNDTVERLLEKTDYDVSCSNCGYTYVAIKSCE